MKTVARFALVAGLALAANVASAIPLTVNVETAGFVGSAGEWSLAMSGSPEGSGSWLHLFYGNDSWDLDVDPGVYQWSISGVGLASGVWWNVLLDGKQVLDGSAGAFATFEFNQDRTFTARTVSVPEPQTLTLLSVGLGLLAFGLRRKRRQSV